MILAPLFLSTLLGQPPSLVPLLALLTGLLVTVSAAALFSLGGTHDREDANLIAWRTGVRPTTWIVAHLDTKSQGHSMAGRLVALWTAIAAAAAAVGVASWHMTHPTRDGVALASAIAVLLAGRLLLRGRLQGKTAGACDNGSGLVALLMAADRASGGGLGFIVTSAEEFGMLGAAALARDRPELLRGAQVINLDTLDDRGTLHVVHHEASSVPFAGQVGALVAGVAPVVRQRKLPLGILVDSLPLGRVARVAITLGRLDWSTLRRVHTPADAPGSLSYATAVAVGEALGARFDPASPGE